MYTVLLGMWGLVHCTAVRSRSRIQGK